MSEKVVSRRITEAAIRQARKKGISEVRDTLIMGFSCMISRDQSVVSFFYRYRSKIEKKRPSVKVGKWPMLSADEARQIVKDWVSDIPKGIEPHIEHARRREEEIERRSPSMTIWEFANGAYREHLMRNKDGRSDLERLRRDFKDWHGRPLKELKKADLIEWQLAGEERGLAFSTIKRSWNVLRALLNHAVELEIIEVNPLQGARLKRPRSDNVDDTSIAGRRRVLESAEVEGLFRGLELYTKEKKRQRRHSRTKAAKQHLPDIDKKTYVDHVVPFILCVYHGGFRPGDLFSLQWHHLNKDMTCISKLLNKTAHHGQYVQRFPLSEPLTEVFQTWWEDQGQPKQGYVFPSPRCASGEKMLSRYSMRKPWIKIKQLGSIPDELDLYSLRHNFASQLVMAGVDLTTVKALMGHASIETTIKYYAHLQNDHLHAALKRLSDAYSAREE
ncbi:tyrosine-type recombinase/integrase [Vreelandella aquamarina]